MNCVGITRGAALAINDFLDNCCNVKAGDEVVIAAHVDGMAGGDNLVDPQVISWLQNAIQARNANPTVLWLDEPAKIHHWRIPPVFMAALKASDIFINCSYDLTIEELKPIQEAATEYGVTLCRLFATTPGLLNSPWVQTPYELQCEIRYQACVPLGRGGMPYTFTAPNGTHLEGTILPSTHPRFPTYTRRRNEGPGYRPFPEWVFPPVNLGNTNGELVFDRTLGWWSRYIGLSPIFDSPVKVTVENCRIKKMEGGKEAEFLFAFMKEMEQKVGDEIWKFGEVHAGIHPCPIVAPQQCNHPLIQRIVDHSASSCVHFHLGAPWPSEAYPYWLHITADVHDATWKVGDTYIHKSGHMTALDHPKVKEIAEKYPDFPGIGAWPKNF